MINNNDLIEIGFTEVPTFTITNSVTYSLGRSRFLSGSSIGTPNEMLWIYESDIDNPRKIDDIICLHNYDYDGYLTMDKVKGLIELIS